MPTPVSKDHYQLIKKHEQFNRVYQNISALVTELRRLQTELSALPRFATVLDADEIQEMTTKLNRLGEFE